MKNGLGCMQMLNGDKYIGNFKNDTFNGKGKLMFSSGDYYEGDFKDGKINGIGSYVILGK